MINHQKMQGKQLKTFSFLKVLGKGAWAVVYEAIDERDGNIVAVKAIPKMLLKRTPKLEQLVKTEIKVLKQCSQLKPKNQNIIRYVDNWMSENSILIAMEYCNGGDLEQYLDAKKRLTEDEANNFLKQILNGFRALHEVKAMHRDFKLANVLLHQGVCKIADLGFAKQMEKKMTTTILGTSLTMAPQLLEERPYGMEADIWSVGVVYYQMLYGKYPFMGMSDPDILKKIRNTRPDFSAVFISQNARDFINRCLTVNPKNRITWSEIYDHPLIKTEQKMIYGLRSSVRVMDNKNFYQQGVKVNEDYMYLERNIQRKESSNETVIEQAQPIKPDYVAGLLKKNQQKKEIDNALKQYEKLYLNRRNNIMFIFKFVTPNIYKLAKIKANHDITLFIITKKAFHDMKQLYRLLDQRVNFLKLTHFTQFANSLNYKEIKEKFKSDIEVIEFQMTTYRDDIHSCSNEIKQQFNVQKIYHSQWQKFVKEIINSYEFQLAEGLDTLQGERKNDLISLIEALRYYRDNTENAQIQEFDRKMTMLNYEEAELGIRTNLSRLLQWN